MQDGQSFTVKEIVLETQKEVRELDAKLDLFIRVHEQRHIAEQEVFYDARADPSNTAAGRKILADVRRVSEAGRATRDIVTRHDALIQRLIGAVTLASFLGAGTLVLVLSRILGIAS